MSIALSKLDLQIIHASLQETITQTRLQSVETARAMTDIGVLENAENIAKYYAVKLRHLDVCSHAVATLLKNIATEKTESNSVIVIAKTEILQT
jgi:hypothetical protein